MKQFRPSFISKQYVLKCRLNKGHYGRTTYNFRNRINSTLPIMIRIFSKLHYLGSHSYVQNKWYAIEKKFVNRHRGLDL